MSSNGTCERYYSTDEVFEMFGSLGEHRGVVALLQVAGVPHIRKRGHLGYFWEAPSVERLVKALEGRPFEACIKIWPYDQAPPEFEKLYSSPYVDWVAFVPHKVLDHIRYLGWMDLNLFFSGKLVEKEVEDGVVFFGKTPGG